MKLDGPFVVGQAARGQVTNPQYAHVTLVFVVTKIEPERVFAYTWHPYAVDMAKDYSSGDAYAGRISSFEKLRPGLC